MRHIHVESTGKVRMKETFLAQLNRWRMSARQFRHRRGPDARWTPPRKAAKRSRDCRPRRDSDTAASARGRADAGGVMRIIIAVAVVSLAAATAICSSSGAEPTATELTDADAARIAGCGAPGYRIPPTREAGSPDRVDRRPAAILAGPLLAVFTVGCTRHRRPWCEAARRG